MIKKFMMIRQYDVTGISGSGHVLDGVQFNNGKVVIAWNKGIANASSIVVWDCFDDFYRVHIARHPENETIIIWEDEPNYKKYLMLYETKFDKISQDNFI